MNLAQRMINSLNVLFFIVLSGLAINFNVSAEPVHKAVDGVIDLRGQINENRLVSLEGEWDFFYNQLLSPQEIEQHISSKKHIDVPKSWDLSTFDPDVDFARGYGTYHLKILMDDFDEPIAIYIPVINSAYRLFVDQDLRVEVGEVGTSEASTSPHYAPQPLILFPENPEVNLTIQVSNYGYNWGGLAKSLRIGKLLVLSYEIKKQVMNKIFISGFLFAIMIYNLALFSLRRSNPVPLIFALFCLCLGIREYVVENYLILNYFPTLGIRSLLTADHLSFFIAVVFGMHFNYLIFKQHFNFFFVKTTYFCSLVASAGLIIFGLNISHITLLFMQIYALFSVAYVFYILLLAYRAKQKGTRIMALGSVILGFCIINDILYAMEIIQSKYLASFGTAVYVLSQSYLTAINLNKGFMRSKLLSKKLEKQNIELKNLTQQQEDKIIERTNELALANKHLEQLAHNDALTEILNRHGMLPIIEQEQARFDRNQVGYSIALLDLDHFKCINDKFGHIAGDKVLKAIVDIVKNIIRDQDQFSRWGGDEFVLLLPDTDIDGAKKLAEKIRRAVEQISMSIEYQQISLSVTIGVAEIRANEQFSEVLKRADKATFKGKEQGSNQVVCDRFSN